MRFTPPVIRLDDSVVNALPVEPLAALLDEFGAVR
jgi:hypothetical protein